ncbi:MAG: hypothetical protein H0T79_19570 [Deltaproteobacteria bacterium]|nr:hypothetical protein [Deltaproteobacteria bacterium]
MKRLLAVTLFGLVAAAACKSPAKQPPLVPSTQLDTTKAEPKKEEPKEPVAEAQPAAPKPIHVSIAAPKVTVKLISKGKGKLAKLALAPKQGASQQVELALDFTTKEDGAGGVVVPTVVLVGDTEVKSVGADGGFDQQFTCSSVDVRNASPEMPADKLKPLLVSLIGMTIGGPVGANGIAGDVTFHIEKPDQFTPQALQLIGLAWPNWPAFPSEPIGPGAKWQSTTVLKLADRFEVSVVADYELISHTGTTWKAKGKIKVSGADQALDAGKITNITGGGETEVTIEEGQVVPTFKTKVATKFKASEKDEKTKQDKMVSFELTTAANVKKP